MNVQEMFAVSLAVRLSLWKDAVPLTKFPSIRELVRMELSNILTHPEITRRVPKLKAMRRQLLTMEPWETDPRIIDDIKQDDLKDIDASFLAFLSDPTLDMVRIHSKPALTTPEMMRGIVRGIARELGVTDTTEMNEKAVELYEFIHAHLLRGARDPPALLGHP
jgi:hypothetical protein